MTKNLFPEFSSLSRQWLRTFRLITGLGLVILLTASAEAQTLDNSVRTETTQSEHNSAAAASQDPASTTAGQSPPQPSNAADFEQRIAKLEALLKQMHSQTDETSSEPPAGFVKFADGSEASTLPPMPPPAFNPIGTEGQTNRSYPMPLVESRSRVGEMTSMLSRPIRHSCFE